MNYTEFISSTKLPLYVEEGKDPACPKGFVWNKEMNSCVPDVKKKNKKESKTTENKDSQPVDHDGFMVFGSNGMDGGYAWEEKPREAE
jgi:hypothetical protein